MSRHEGVSCDSCLKGNFRGRRYKCLVCYDYDLCATCYEGGATNTRHTTDHPMQCILTRSDYELYYGGEALTSLELPQSYTCPYCSRMGFTDVTLQEHVTADHQDINFEVVCPLCAAMPGGDPNLMTDDFSGHLTLEHRTGARDLISFLDEPVGTRHNVRRIPHNTSHGTTHLGRGATAALRPRRSNMHFGSGGLSSSSPSSRDSVDPIAELLSQLSGLLEELSLQCASDQIRRERSRFVQELVIASAERKIGDQKTTCIPNIKSIYKQKENRGQDLPKEAATCSKPRPINVVLRGRARSDAQNAKRRAEANRNSQNLNIKESIDPNNGARAF
ncbi:E3 ubiquitin-protein ligase Kcmf1-like isoform X2 [Diabrotica undecimpunctata]|uniref:E3 ubiquitin-protein ligase Kcmf1-like isoform X2 n=1 Tax=Diabrotica undecimpunctata TaxID=50387 RepID=UPI003B63DD83